MRIAYLDCLSGISGDMFIGSLLDAGLSFEQIQGTLSGLKLGDYRISATPEERNHIFGTRFSVTLQEADQAARHLDDIRQILKNSDLPLPVIQRSIQVFENLAKIEGDIHHISPKKVHFHEVGAVDSIVDIVATVAGIELLGIEKVFASKIPVGSGIITSAHGRIPIPSPATLALLKGIPIYSSGQDVEMVTPTGAALISSLCSLFGPMPPMVVEQVGYGVGSRRLSDRPNLLRILIGSDTNEENTETVVVLEANLDELLSRAYEKKQAWNSTSGNRPTRRQGTTYRNYLQGVYYPGSSLSLQPASRIKEGNIGSRFSLGKDECQEGYRSGWQGSVFT